MLSGPKRAPMRKVPPVSKGAPTIAASAFSRSWTFGRRMKVRTPENRGVSKESAGAPVHPDRGEPQLPGGHDVVEEALGGVQEPLRRDAHSVHGDLEVVGGGLVGAGLLGGDDPVELDLEAA